MTTAEFYISEEAMKARLSDPSMTMDARMALIQTYRPCSVCQDHIHRDRILFVTLAPDRPILSGPQANFAISLYACDRCGGKLIDDPFKKLLDEALNSTDRGNP